MSISRPSPRLRRLAASTGALALAGTLALSGVAGGGVEMTEAAWSDTEVATARIQASWPTEWFARSLGNSWQSVNTVYDSNGIPYSRQPSGGILADYDGPGDNFAVFARISTENQTPENSTGNPTRLSTISGDNYTVDNSLASSNTATGPRIWMGRTNEAGRAITRHCIDDPKSFVPLGNGCTGGAQNSFVEASHDLKNLSLSISTVGDNTTKSGRLNANGISTSVRCFPAAEGLTPQATLAIPRPASLPSGFGGDRISVARQLTAISYSYDNEKLVPLPGQSTESIGMLNDGAGPWYRANINDMAGDNGRLAWYIRVRTDRYVQKQPVYAKSEVSAEIQLYSDNYAGTNNGVYVGSVHVVLSRSECGIGRYPTRDFFYNGTDQAGRVQDQPRWTVPFFPTGRIPNSLNGEYTPPLGRGIAAARDSTTMGGVLEVDEAAAAELPPTTTVTSPLENSTASGTTTSAPPNPSGEDESPTAGTSTAAATSTPRRTTTVTSRAPTVTAAPTSASTPSATQATTSTSAAPAAVIPDEPGTLSPAARIEDVGIVEVDGEDLVVVVKGTSVPTGARTALTALDTWINAARQPSGDWTTFTSTDPDEDGWRWAAINQKTGTVVYVR